MENMKITELIDSINASEKFPLDEINALLERKEESLPVLLELVRSLSIDYKRMKLDRLDLIVACYILSQWRERRAFPYLIKLASIPSDWIEPVWGDVITEDFTSFLVSTFDGNIEALNGLIGNEAAHFACRAAALDTLVGLVAEKILTREAVLDYFKALMKSDLVYDYEFSCFLIDAAHKLHPQEIYSEIVVLFEQNLVDVLYISKENIDEALSQDKDEWLKSYLYEDKSHLPINNALEALSDWLDFESMEALQNLPCIRNNFKNFKDEHSESCC